MPKIIGASAPAASSAAPAAAALNELGNLPPEVPAEKTAKPKRAPRKPKAVPAAAKELANELAVSPKMTGKRMKKEKADVVSAAEVKPSEKAKAMSEKMKKRKSTPKAKHSEMEEKIGDERVGKHGDLSDAKIALEIEKRRLKKNMEDAKETRKVINEIRSEISEMRKKKN
jgi:hypothetical protein